MPRRSRIRVAITSLRQAAVSLAVVMIGAGPLCAETTDFGGNSQRFRGNGDKTPPRCQINVPRSATAPFFVTWACTDDVSRDDEIITELWILRQGELGPKKIAEFLGFPASVQIHEGFLGTQRFVDGLPVSFRLVARDRAGVAAMSDYVTVVGQDNAVERCDLRISTSATQADGGTTGLPAMTVVLEGVPVEPRQTSNSTVRIATSGAVTANPCEIESVCDDDEEVAFESTLTLAQDDDSAGTAVTGSISVSPGFIRADLEGSAELSGNELRRLEASGMTVVEGLEAEVSLTCSR